MVQKEKTDAETKKKKGDVQYKNTTSATIYFMEWTVTLAEMAAMYRLKTLISISAGLVDVITRAKTWTKENVKLIESCRANDVLPMALSMFEATSAIGEIFQLKSIDRSTAKKEFKKHLRKDDDDEYISNENKTLVITEPKVYIPPLELRINHYREVKELIERLPPMYMKVKAEVSLSKYTGESS
ncbi:hypothetical protein KIN20_020136 [Parelaphostrongylus tenuis]|uniref:Uncharacterized protein n=1 Tax=Parelaphostrongylus tenuis TaxID=148309 RepID=A0AAD5N660_PARTN|nr:hypothetical protein KIN20_020136 [Parelaphostrongylus tenuis]